MESDQIQAKSKSLSKSSKAQIIFPVNKILKKMKNSNYAKRISVKAGVCMATTLEYLVAEVIELSGDQCISESDSQINPEIRPDHISLGIRNDPELYDAVGRNIFIPYGGFLNLHKP